MLHKVSHSPRVLVQVTAGKTLVRAVEEGVVALGADNLCNPFPLFLRRVNTSGVVCTRVNKENRAIRRVIERLDESVEIKPDRLGIIVRIFNRLDSDIPKDRKVVDCSTLLAPNYTVTKVHTHSK